MLHEEFTRLSGVHTTAKFYQEVIEHQYMDVNIEKEEFVEKYLKDNKKHIVKAHEFDIDRASQKLAVVDCNAAAMVENKRLQHELEELNEKFKYVRGALAESKHIAEDWENKYRQVNKKAEQADILEARIKDREKEIVQLKARLFDFLEQ